MSIFSSFGGDKSSLMQKLKQRRFQNAAEKMAIVEQLQEHKLLTKDVLWMLRENDEFLRNLAVQTMRRDSSSDVLKLLLQEINNDKSAEHYILPAIVAITPPGVLRFVKKMISSRNLADRQLAMKLAARFPNFSRFFEVYCEAIADPDEGICYQAVVKLAPEIRSDKIFELLRPLLDKGSSRIRHRIIQAMTKLEDPKIVDPFFERLALESEDLQKSMITALIKLAKNPDSGIERRILPSLSDEDEFTRQTAAQLLSYMPDKKQLIREFLEYNRGVAHWLRERAYKTFATIAQRIANEILELLEDEEQTIRIESMLLAAYIDDARIVPGVIKIVESDVDWWIKTCAIDILAKFKTTEVAAALATLEEDPDLRWSVISAYGVLQPCSALTFLQRCLQTGSPYMQLSTLRSLAQFKTPEAMKIIEGFAETTTEWNLQNEILQIFGGNLPQSIHFEKPDQLDLVKVMADLKALGIEMEDEGDLDVEADQQDEDTGRNILRPSALETAAITRERPALDAPQEAINTRERPALDTPRGSSTVTRAKAPHRISADRTALRLSPMERKEIPSPTQKKNFPLRTEGKPERRKTPSFRSFADKKSSQAFKIPPKRQNPEEE